jgi:hypothetical protein
MAVRELAQRTQNGLIVRLLWDSIRDCVILRCRDLQSGEAFSAEVPKAHALAAFHHPHVYRR